MGLFRDLADRSIDFVRDEIIPLRGELYKAGILTPDNKAYDQKASLVDPFSYQQTAYGYKEKWSVLDYSKLRQVTYADPIVAAVIQTRLNQVANFSAPQADKFKGGYKISMKDVEAKPTPASKKRAKEIEQFILNCGTPESFEDTPERKRRDNFETFLRKISRDSLTFDQINFEVTPRKNGMPYQMQAIDASTIRLIPDSKEFTEAYGGGVNKQHQTPLQYNIEDIIGATQKTTFDEFKPKYPKYVQIINGRVMHSFDEWELAFGVRNPRSDIVSSGYGFSEIEMMITTITSHMNAEAYNRKFFCLPGSTRVATSDGYLPIEDVFKNVGDGSGMVWTGNKWTEFGVVKTGLKQLAKTEFKNGHVIETSPDHRFRVYNGDLKLGWKRQSDLYPGDYVLSDSKGFECESKTAIDSDLWEVLGWIMADGNIGKSVSLHYRSRDESYIRDRHMAVLERHGIPFSKDDRARDPSKDFSSEHPMCGLAIYSVKFLSFCHELGFESAKYKGGHLPAGVFQESIENRRAFLKGVFSGNGYTGSNSVTVTFVNDRILSDLQLLLSSVGLYSYEVGGRTLYVNQPSKFIDEIGFIQDSKTDSIKKERVTYGTHIDSRLARDICRAVYGPQSQRVGYSRDGEKTLLKDVSQRSKLTDHALPRFRAIAYHGEGVSLSMLQKHLGDAGITEFDHLLSRGFTQVKNATQTDESVEMYDLCCHDDIHEFVAEGVVVHNSQGSVTKGVMTFEGTVPPDQLESFRRQWHQQVSGIQNAWRTPIMSLGKDTKLNWVDLHANNREMEYGKWLDYCIKTICGVFQMDPIEIGFDISKQSTQGGGGGGLGSGNPQEKILFSQEKGLKPLLRHIECLINDYVVSRLDPDFKLEFVGFNIKSEKDDLDQAAAEVKAYKTVNEIRAERDMDPIPPLDKIESLGDILLDPQWIQQFGSVKQAEQMGPDGQPMGPDGQPMDPEGEPDDGQEDDGPPEPPATDDSFPSDDELSKMKPDELQGLLSKLQGGDEKPGKPGGDKGAKDSLSEPKSTKKSLVLEL